MESPLPGEIIYHIAQYIGAAAHRCVSKLFCRAIDAAILDNTSPLIVLCTKGDLFSVIVRFGDRLEARNLTENMINCITFYMKYRSQAHISFNIIQQNPFGISHNLWLYSSEIERVHKCMDMWNVKLKLARFPMRSVLAIKDDITITDDFIREIDKLTDNADVIHGDIYSSNEVANWLRRRCDYWSDPTREIYWKIITKINKCAD